ncbi:MAG: AMP-binding protein [Desulfobacterium sp.]|nr:AMP-binding protein [Desulfobacterium sp.]
MDTSHHTWDIYGIHDIFKRNAHLFPNKPAIRDRHGTLSHGELLARINALACGLSAIGISKGATIAVLSMNRNDYLTVYGGAAALGAIVVPINWRLSDQEIDYILKDSRAKILFVDDAHANRCEFEGRRICFGCDTSTAHTPFEELLETEKTLISSADTADAAGKDDPFCLLYTAAVTGSPRGAVLSHGNIIASNLQTALTMGITQDDVYLNMLPLFHITGINLSFSTMQMGGGNVIMEKFNPEEALTLVEREKITLMASFPPILATLTERLNAAPKDTSSLRNITGIDSSENILAFTRLTDSRFWVFYGQGETSGFVTMADSMERPGSAGREALISRVAILDKNDKESPPDTLGEIGVRGPLVFQGFWDLEKLDRSTFKNGWHHTGDLGQIDRDGYLWFKGRKPEKELIKPGGENVYPAEVEAVIQLHPGIEESCVIGVPDPKFGEGVKAVCTAKKGEKITAADLIEFVGSRIARYKKPSQVVFVESLPRNADGSIDRNKVKELYS